MSGVKHTVATLLHHHSSKEETTPEVIEQEKHFVAQFSEGPHAHLPADEFKNDPQNKQLGGSSRGLGVEDFILIKTLGTGEPPVCFGGCLRVIWNVILKSAY